MQPTPNTRSMEQDACEEALRIGPTFQPGGSPSFPGDPLERIIERRQASQTPQDCVDEASMESFPASDPPASTTCHA